MNGIIFDIKRFAVHDGPGIRTTVFLKGCPLKCAWCHNPESINPNPCTINKVSRIGELTFTDLETVGQTMTVEEVMKVVEREMVFMDESGGGVTFSGGEPLLQPEFLRALLIACKSKGIHTAVDTCGFAAPKVLQEIAPLTDLFLYDLKLMDSEMHKHFTGVHNEVILENLAKLISDLCKIRIRIPIIKGINDSQDNMKAIIELLKGLNGSIEGIDLLPFHNTAVGKYKRIDLQYNMNNTQRPDAALMSFWQRELEAEKYEVKIGG